MGTRDSRCRVDVRFTQVDVFGRSGLDGNPVAVVHCPPAADAPQDATMQAFARWTNLSETTFLLPPSDAGADYRLRIFTPTAELPFAGHPTLGSAHAWLEAGGTPAGGDVVVQECGAGLVEVRREEDGQLAFAAPPLLRSGPVDPADLETLRAGLRLAEDQVVDAAWVDNGPGWVALLLPDAAQVLAVRPDVTALAGWDVGLAGPHPEGGPADFEVRAICPDYGIPEDPVTGSLNAGLGQWLIGSGRAPSSYTVRQGTVIGRDGDVRVRELDGRVWVSGACRTVVTGTVALP